MGKENNFGEMRNKNEFWCGCECARRWMIYRLSIGEGSFIDEFRRLWSFSLDRQGVDSWSRGFFFKLDCCEYDAREWQRGCDPLPVKLRRPTPDVKTNFLAAVCKPDLPAEST